jgi:NitT/TauT family transport system ATP-binding protein
LLLDEPFSAIDALTRARLHSELGQILDARGFTTLLVTHDLHEAALLADRVIALAGPPLRVLLDLPVISPAPRGRRDLYDPRVGELVRALRAALDLDTTP